MGVFQGYFWGTTMGTTLHAVVEEPGAVNWHHIASFDFGKDYPAQLYLGEVLPTTNPRSRRHGGITIWDLGDALPVCCEIRELLAHGDARNWHVCWCHDVPEVADSSRAYAAFRQFCLALTSDARVAFYCV